MRKGTKHSQETKDQMSKASKGRPKSEAHKKAKSVAVYGVKSRIRRECVVDGVEYLSVADAARKLNMPYYILYRRIRLKDEYLSYYYKYEDKQHLNEGVISYKTKPFFHR